MQSALGEMSDRERRAQGDGPACDEIDSAPEAHVFVGRAWAPIDPVDAEIFLSRRGGFDGEDIGLTGLEQIGYVEVVSAIGAGDCGGVGDLVSIEPDFAAIVDAAEMEPNARVRG